MGSPGFVSADELRPRVAEGVISDAGPCSRTGFNFYLKSMADQFAHRIGGEGNAFLVNLDFLRYADAGHRSRQDGR